MISLLIKRIKGWLFKLKLKRQGLKSPAPYVMRIKRRQAKSIKDFIQS